MEKRFVLKSLAEMEKFANSFLQKLKPQKGEATVLALSGDLGSGKTTFTQSLAKALGVRETVTSPTFVIEKIYLLKKGRPFLRLIHIDCYRLNKAEDLEVLGWDEIAASPENLIILEWPERVDGLVAEKAHKLNFSFVDENTREVSI